jgi:hypothetical protein
VGGSIREEGSLSLPPYSQVLQWIKDAGFEQWSWVVAVLTVVFAFIAWLFRNRKPHHGLSQQTNQATGSASVGQQIGGSGNTVIQNNQIDSVLVSDLLNRISVKDRELGQKDQLIASQTAEIQALRRQAIETVVESSQQPSNNQDAKSALNQMRIGSIDLAQSLLRALEQRSSAQMENQLAARLAREQAALWLGRNVEAAYEAFERSYQFDPEYLPNLWHLIELAKKCQSLAQAAVWASLVLQRTEKLAASDPKNSDWQRDLSVSYGKCGGHLGGARRAGKSIGRIQKIAGDPRKARGQRPEQCAVANGFGGELCASFPGESSAH